MTSELRRPRAFVLDGDKPAKTRSRINIEVEEQPQDTSLTVPTATAPNLSRTFRWGTVLWLAVSTLFMMWLGLTATQLVESFFARAAWLGWTASAIAAIAAISAIAIIVREVMGLVSLNKIETLQDEAAHAINFDDRASADRAVTALESIYAREPETAWGLKEFRSHRNEVMSPHERLQLADRLLVQPRDQLVQKIIAKRARRVTLLTAVTPAAALDILFVAMQNLSMLREIATSYGGRPSTLSNLKLARMVATHLAVTGGLALSDTVIQHVVGKGLIGRLSARFGEGAVNGILTTRIGLAAARVCRPIPAKPGDNETLASMVRELFTLNDAQQSEPGSPAGP
jgi:putative membrane protein